MALGQLTLTIGKENFVVGMSTSDNTDNGGFSPRSDAVNLIASPGVLYQPAQPTDKSTNVVGEIIASSEDPQLLGADRVLVDDEGNYYSWNGTTVSLERTDATNPSGYVAGKTDMEAFDGSVFTSTSETIVKWTVDSVFTDDFITGLNASVPHPLLRFEGYLYFGDGNLLKRIDDASDATPTTILTLDSQQNIIALGIDPGSGKMLVSTTQGLNISDTRANTNRVGYYDGFSEKFLRVVTVEDMVTAFWNSGGQVVVGYGPRIGEFTGSGISLLRELNVGFDNNELPYKQHGCFIGETFYLIEQGSILAFGDVIPGQKVFYYAFKNNVNSNDLTHICNLGQNVLGMAFATDKFYTWSVTSVSTSNTQTFYSNKYEFEDDVWIRKIRIFWDSAITNNVDPGSLSIISENGVETSIGQSGLIDLRNTTGGTIYWTELADRTGFSNVKLSTLQIRLILDTVNPGIRKMVVYYDPANLT